MKLCKTSILRNHGGHFVLVPIDCQGPTDVIPLSEVEAYLWDHFEEAQTKEDLVCLVTSKYLASVPMAEKLVEHFLKTLFLKKIIYDF